MDGPAKPKWVVSERALWATFPGGREVLIDKRLGIAGYTYAEPSISNIEILDANGDGEPDFLYDVDNAGRHLVFTKGERVIRNVMLITTEYSGVGGC